MKKATWLRFVVIMTALVLLLSACGTSPSPAASTATAVPADKPADTTVDSTDETSEEPDANEVAEFSVAVRRGHLESGSVVQNYFEDKFNVKINMVIVPDTSDAQAKVNLLMADASQRPDVIWFQTGWTKEYTQWRDAGLLVDVSEYYWRYPNIREYYDKVSPDSMFYAAEPDGSLYAIPGDVGEPGHMTTLIRKDWLEYAGLAIPTTFDEYVAALREMSKNNPLGTNAAFGFAGSPLEFRSMKPFYTQFNVIPDQFYSLDDGTVVYGAIQPEMKDALALLRDLYSEGVIDPNMLLKDFNFTESFTAGTFGSTYRWIAWMNPEDNSVKSFKENNPDGEYISLEPFANPQGNQSDNSISPQAWCAFAITDQAENPERIYAFFDSLIAPEEYLIRVFGFEGEQYTRENGLFKPIENQPENIGTGLFDTFVNRKDEYNIRNTPEVAAMFARGTELVQPDLNRICYVKSPDRPVWNEYKTEIERIRDEYIWGIIAGQRPLEDFDAFVDLFYAQGGAEVLAETAAIMEQQVTDYANFKANFKP